MGGITGRMAANLAFKVRTSFCWLHRSFVCPYSSSRPSTVSCLRPVWPPFGTILGPATPAVLRLIFISWTFPVRYAALTMSIRSHGRIPALPSRGSPAGATVSILYSVVSPFRERFPLLAFLPDRRAVITLLIIGQLPHPSPTRIRQLSLNLRNIAAASSYLLPFRIL